MDIGPLAADLIAPPPQFLRLPQEIRDQVYRYLLIDYEPINLDPKHSIILDAKPFTFKCSTSRLSSQILSSCRHIHGESYNVLYGENTFTLPIYDGVMFKKAPSSTT